MPKDPAQLFRMVLTGALVVLFTIAVVVTLANVAAPIMYASDGKVLAQPFSNAKDILTVLGATLSLVLGYWFGAAGKARSDAAADAATTQSQQLTFALAQLSRSASAQDIEAARRQFPDAFAGSGAGSAPAEGDGTKH